MSINKAQALNNHIQNEISLGSSPQIVKQTFNKPPMARTVKELLKSYLEFHLTPNLKSGSKIHGIIENHIIPVIGEMKLSDVGTEHLYATVNSCSNGVKAAVLSAFRQMFEFGFQFRMVDHNRFKDVKSKRFNIKTVRGAKTLEPHELSLFFITCEKHNIRRVDLLAMALYMTLGVRKCELLDAPWSEFNLNNGIWYLPPKRTKTLQGISIPLAPQVINWLEEIRYYNPHSEYLFPARKRSNSPTLHASTLNRSLAPVLKELDINIHGQRHLAFTLMESLGIPEKICHVCINHREKRGEGDVYSHWLFIDERKEAHFKLAALVSKYVPQSILTKLAS